MRKPLSAVGCCLILFASCAPQEPAVAPLAAPPPAPAPAPVAASAAPAPAEAPKEAAKPVELTPEQSAKAYTDCWAAFNARDWTKFTGCFADNATSEEVDMSPAISGNQNIVEKSVKPFAAAFPEGSAESQLVLVNGQNVAGVWLFRGTQKGPLASPHGELAPTNKKIGLLVGHVVELSAGKATSERTYFDAHTMMSQLGVAPGPARKVMEQGAAEKPVVLATGNDTEKANVEVYKKFTEAFDKHDSNAVDALLTDDFVYSDQAAPADLVGKKEAQRGLKEIWKGMSDAKLTPSSVWGAGDYVVSTGVFSGTNDGPIPSLKINKKTGKQAQLGYLAVAKLQGGKLKQEWVFNNGMAFAAQLGLLPPPKEGKAGGEKSAPAKSATEKPKAAASKTPAAEAKPATPASKLVTPMK